jgi:uroporphyrinogen-III synthase
MRLLVTRAEPDALKLKAALERLGHEATVEPLLQVEPQTNVALELDGVQALIATSRNGVRALKSHLSLALARTLPMFAVGKATAEEARALGFETVITGAGTANELVTHIVAVVDPSAGLLLHLAGDHLAVDMCSELEAHGFRVAQAVVYRSVAAKTLSEETVEQLAEGEIDGVILLSPRTAAVYASLMRRQGLSTVARTLTHFCLSEAVARQLTPLRPVRTAIADAPRVQEVLALVERAAAELEG